MPIVNGQYQAPTWVNGNRPAINASELQAICNTLAGIPSNYYTQEQTLNSVVKALFGQGSDATPNAIFQILANAVLSQNGNLVTPGGISIPNVQIEIGSYIGTGTFGINNPTVISFSIPVDIVIVPNYTNIQHPGSADGSFSIKTGNYDTYSWVELSSHLTTEYVENRGFAAKGNSSTNFYGKKSSDNKNFYTYNEQFAEQQMNKAGYEYFYIGFGLLGD